MTEPTAHTLVITAHAGDFVWRAGGAIALATSRGEQVTIACLTFGERGESARAWREGRSLEEIKGLRREEAEAAAAALGADVRFLDAGDYPLLATPDLDRRAGPASTARCSPPSCSPTRWRTPTTPTTRLRHGWRWTPACWPKPWATPPTGEALGAPPVFFFEPHQPEMCGFRPEVLLDITEVWETKQAAMQCLGGPAAPLGVLRRPRPATRHPAQAQRGSQPRPALDDLRRGVHALLPPGHGPPRMRTLVVTDTAPPGRRRRRPAA